MPEANESCPRVRGSNSDPHASVAVGGAALGIAMIQIANLFGIISVPNKGIDLSVRLNHTRYNTSQGNQGKYDDDLGCTKMMMI